MLGFTGGICFSVASHILWTYCCLALEKRWRISLKDRIIATADNQTQRNRSLRIEELAKQLFRTSKTWESLWCVGDCDFEDVG
jgi:hypothetical protein